MLNTFKADLLYGASGVTKTSNIGRVALRYHKLTGRRTRLVSADGGGWDPIQPLVDSGIVEPWPIRLWPHRVETIDKASQGYWPQNLNDPLSPLEPPTVVAWSATCPRCRNQAGDGPLLVYGPAPSQPRNLVCPQCKAVAGPRDIDLKVAATYYPNPKNDLRQVALVAFEGLTSFGDSLLEYLMATKATLSQEPSYSWPDGDQTYSGGNQTYYGFVQNRLYEFVHKSHMIPFVEKIIWTALEGKGEEEATRVPIFGPAIAGKKATGKAPQWFGNTLHFEMATTVESGTDANQQAKVTTRPVLYLRTHADALSRIPFQAKTRAPFQYYQELPDFMEADVAKLYDKLDELNQRVKQELQKAAAVAAPAQPATQPAAAAAAPK